MALLPEQGRLEETSFPGLILDLHRARFSGKLRLDRDRVEKGFLFLKGVPVYAESNLNRERLGVQLVDAGTLSQEDYDRVTRHVESTGCQEGKALLDLEMMEPRGLFLALKEQVRTRLVECFGWTRGSFNVEPGEPAPDEAQPFRADIYSLLQEGIEAHWSDDRILANLAPRMNLLAGRTALLSRIQNRLLSDAAVEAFLDALDGTRALWETLQCAKTPRGLAAAWLLDAVGAIEYADPEGAKEAVEDELPPEIEIVLEDAAEEGARADTSAADAAAEAAPADEGEDPKAVSLYREIADKFARLSELDHYALLGVDGGADAGEIRRAYLQAAKFYHPDALSRLHIEGEVRKQANKLFAEIGKAHAVLSNPARRRDYDASLSGGSLDAEQIAAAETLYRKGEILLKQGNFRGALEFLQPAVEIYPEEGDYRHALGWAMYKKMPSEPEIAKAHLERAVELSPSDGVVLFRLGVVLRSLGEAATADELMARARSLDPNVS